MHGSKADGAGIRGGNFNKPHIAPVEYSGGSPAEGEFNAEAGGCRWRKVCAGYGGPAVLRRTVLRVLRFRSRNLTLAIGCVGRSFTERWAVVGVEPEESWNGGTAGHGNAVDSPQHMELIPPAALDWHRFLPPAMEAVAIVSGDSECW